MATFRFVSCPYCKFKIRDWVQSGGDKIGHPMNICPNCKNIFRTGMNYWFDISKEERFAYLVKNYLLGFLGSIIFGHFIMFMLYSGGKMIYFNLRELPDKGLTDVEIYLMFFLGILYSIFLLYSFHKNTQQHIKKYSDPEIKIKLIQALENGQIIDINEL